MKIKEVSRRFVEKVVRPVKKFFTSNRSFRSRAPLVAGLLLAACGSADVGGLKPKPDAGITGMDANVPVDAGPTRGWPNRNARYCQNVAIGESYNKDMAHPVILDPTLFKYAHAKVDLSDVTFFPGTCGDTQLGEAPLAAFVEFADTNGLSAVWIRNPTGSASVAMYFGDPTQTTISDPKAVFILWGKGRDFSKFNLRKDERGTLRDTDEGIRFTGFPFGNGQGETYVAADIGSVQDFELSYTITYEGNRCRPYFMVAVSDTLSGDFVNHYDGVGVFRKSCQDGMTRLALRSSNRRSQTNQDSQFIPFEGATYFVRMQRIGTTAFLTVYTTPEERTLHIREFASAQMENVPPTVLRYVFPALALDPADATRFVDGVINDVRFFPFTEGVRAKVDPAEHMVP